MPSLKPSDDLEKYKDLIWCWYIGEDRSKKDVVQRLNDRGVNIKQSNLERRMRLWDMRKNVTDAEGKWMARQQKLRKDKNKKTHFLLSGKRMAEEKIRRAIQRHSLEEYSLLHKFQLFSETEFVSSGPGSALVVCSPLTSVERPWQPWIQFNDRVLEGSVRLEFVLPSRPRLSVETTSLATVTDPSKGFQRLKVDKVAAVLDWLVPESFPEENVRAADSLTQSWPKFDIVALKFFIFRLSNNLIQNENHIDRPVVILRLCQSLGLAQVGIIRGLFKLAPENPTIAAVLDALFQTAWITESVDLMSLILAENKRVDNGKPTSVVEFPVWHAIEHAIRRSNRRLLDAAICFSSDYPEDNFNVTQRNEALHLCAGHRNHVFANGAISLLLGKGAKVVNDTGHVGNALFAALQRGNIQLVELLAMSGVNFTITSPCAERPIRRIPAAGYASKITISDHDNAFTSAVVRCCSRNSFLEEFPEDDGIYYHHRQDGTLILEDDKEELERHHFRAQELAVAMFAYLISPQSLITGRGSTWPRIFPVQQTVCVDILIAASFQGYDGLMEKLISGPEDLNRANSHGLWPLYAAIIGPLSKSARVRSSSLHQAINYDSADCVVALLDYGADIECKCQLDDIIGNGKGIHPYHGEQMSPLDLAIYRGFWGIAQILVSRGAFVTSGNFFTAVEHSEISLVQTMMTNQMFDKYMVNPNYGDKTALEVAIHRGNPEMYETLMRTAGSDPVTADQFIAAAKAGSFVLVVESMVDADLNLSQQEFSMALMYALENGHKAITNLLIAEHTRFSTMCPLSDLSNSDRGRAVELAILDGQESVVSTILFWHPKAYSSGMLCACLVMDQLLSPASNKVVCEILRRRSCATEENFDPLLENTAIALAAYHGQDELLAAILNRSWPGHLCAIPEPRFWEMRYTGQDRYRRVKGLIPNESIMMGDSNRECFYYEWCSPDWKLSSQMIGDWNSWRDCPSTCSPLLMAVKGQNFVAVNWLMDRGYVADGPTLKAAIMTEWPIEKLKYLVLSCNDVDHRESPNVSTALFEAIHYRNIEATRALIEHGANVNEGPFYHAEGSFYHAEGHLTTRRTCLQMVIQNFPVWSLASAPDYEAIDLLLDAGADVNAAGTGYGRVTALQLACTTGYIPLARRLIEMGADIDDLPVFPHGWSCLEHAAQSGRLDMVQFLINCGVSVVGRARLQYASAVRLAEDSGRTTLKILLQKYGGWTVADEELLQEDLRIRKDRQILRSKIKRYSKSERERVNLWIRKYYRHDKDDLVDVADDLEQDGPLESSVIDDGCNSDDAESSDTEEMREQEPPGTQQADFLSIRHAEKNAEGGTAGGITHDEVSASMSALLALPQSRPMDESSDIALLFPTEFSTSEPTVDTSTRPGTEENKLLAFKMPLHTSFIERTSVDFHEQDDFNVFLI
ncbi:uncharacterized protein JN550_011599 [Neoarthrinium moseri]|uniref:uncharacterized protein n=1 Tax=Neoarthrinium moseri TaxID=1658444 RepID=UPI001FDE6884|nr:uncharacterized protein JN550_011599 [Neoarthrinium moseri]KAI1860333.1 hypothetical protein JN550_011599 [Neoarthrinium moseri]